jgi:CsoR family transcriptional regulator, copper-sensing transcriptional repressor
MAKKSGTANASSRSAAGSARNANRSATGVDPVARAANLLQLSRAKGQVEGIERMIKDDRYCADVIIQIIAARASLQVVANSLLEAELKACNRAAANNGGASIDTMYQELVGLVSKMAK